MDKPIRTIMQQMTQDAKRIYDRIVFEMVRGGTGFGGWEVTSVLEAEFREASEPTRQGELISVECDSAADASGIMDLLAAIGCQRFSAINMPSTCLVIRRIANSVSPASHYRTQLPEGSRVDSCTNIHQPYLNYDDIQADEREAIKDSSRVTKRNKAPGP